jgi:hypothetical protein
MPLSRWGIAAKGLSRVVPIHSDAFAGSLASTAGLCTSTGGLSYLSVICLAG